MPRGMPAATAILNLVPPNRENREILFDLAYRTARSTEIPSLENGSAGQPRVAETMNGERHKKRKDSRTWTWKWGSLPEKSAFVVPVEVVPGTV